jgi:hypothetical protein
MVLHAICNEVSSWLLGHLCYADILSFVLKALESFYEKFDPDFIDIRTKAREVLQREDDLNEIVQVSFFFYASVAMDPILGFVGITCYRINLLTV